MVQLIDKKQSVLNFRFQGDKNLQESLLSDKRLKKSIDGMLENQANFSKNHIRNLLGNSLRISKHSAPEIHKLFLQCQKKLHLDEKILHAFIYNSSEINANCVFDGDEITIGLTSQLVKVMSEKELTFIIGHEFGHALFDHFKLPAFGLCQGNLVASKALKLMSWSRQAEISADRAGLICCDDLQAATNSFIKLSCGLGEPYVSFNIEDFVLQIDEQKEFEENQDTDECYSTHPLSPLRVSALNNFWMSDSFTNLSKKKTKSKLSDEEMEKKIFEILDYMEPNLEINNKKNKSIYNFLILSSYYVAIADDNLAKEELESLKDICGKKIVEEFLSTLSKQENVKNYIKKQLDESIKDFKTKKKSIKCSTIQKVITIARADGDLAQEEKEALYYLAEQIKLKANFIDQILKFLD